VLESNSPDGLSWDYPVYGWPVPGRVGRLGGFRIARNRIYGQPYTLDVAERQAVIASGRLYRFHPQPGIYHGCMSRAFIKDKLSAADGMCILARSPDTYISMRAVQHGGQFLHCMHPFSMNGYSSKSTGGSFGSLGRISEGTKALRKTAFEIESQDDPVEDLIPLSNSVPLGFLATLETVRHHFPTPPVEVDYLSWYRTVIHDMRKRDANVVDRISQTMTNFAASNGTSAQLQQAMKTPRRALQQASALWHKNADKFRSFRVSAERGGVNTVATASQICDEILGTTYERVLDGQISRSEAWAEAKARHAIAIAQ
jgi:hypothetical protein